MNDSDLSYIRIDQIVLKEDIDKIIMIKASEEH